MGKTKKIALITGSIRGIGKAIAKEMHSLGYSLIINGVSQHSLPESYLDEFSGSKETIHYIQADISIVEDRQKLVEKIIQLNRIDLLVNNAGVAPKERNDILVATETSFDRVMNTNLKGPYFLTQQVAQLMIQFKNNHLIDYNPKIINIGSNSAYTSSPNRGEYCLSKAGMAMMTKLYADRLSEFNIPVFEVRPGIIKTDMTKSVEKKYDTLFKEGITPFSRWGTPIDVAKCVSAIVQGYFPYSTGQVFNVDGGFHLKRL
ncbi:MAG: 3-ketoacyl-ACP reductase [Candidatus Lokiarchaeota archaeon]|nr:3-ketoacyl-ACP reductase [Candidatus Lokiarchaeota archaeon]